LIDFDFDFDFECVWTGKYAAAKQKITQTRQERANKKSSEEGKKNKKEELR
jgi:hypothetical protein